MNIRLADLGDLNQLKQLELTNINDELSGAQQSYGLDGQVFAQMELQMLIEDHWIVIAEREGEIVGYVIAGHWSFFQTWPVYRKILSRLGEFSINGMIITKSNSCQYGPIWIEKTCRGQGIFEDLVGYLNMVIRPHFPCMLTFIAEDNMVSFAAHTNKAAMKVLDFFTFEDRDYYLLVMSTD